LRFIDVLRDIMAVRIYLPQVSFDLYVLIHSRKRLFIYIIYIATYVPVNIEKYSIPEVREA